MTRSVAVFAVCQIAAIAVAAAVVRPSRLHDTLAGLALGCLLTFAVLSQRQAP